MQKGAARSSGTEVETWNKKIFIHSSTPTIDDKYKDFNPSEEQIDLLTKAQNLNKQGVIDRVLSVQNEAHAEYPYPCILELIFVELHMSKLPIYKQILSEGGASRSAIFLDVGCNMGTDPRKLVADGFLATNVYGCDLHQGFIDLGYKLYGDKKSCDITFFAADMFSILEGSSSAGAANDGQDSLHSLSGRVKYLYAGLLFHLFDEPTQTQVARVFARLARRERGTIIFGSHIGNLPAGPFTTSFSKSLWGHSPDTFSRMWKAVFTELEGETFVQEHVKIVVEVRKFTRTYKVTEVIPYLDWSVSVV